MASKNYEKLVYASKNKSKVIDFNQKKVLFNHENGILAAEFSEKHKFLVFRDSNNKIFILKDYTKLIEIKINLLGYQFYLCSNENEMKLIIRQVDSGFAMVDITKAKLESVGRKLRNLRKNFTYPKKALLISCLNYNSFIV